MNEKKIYNLNQIEGACVIGSPIVAGILIAHNYRAMGEHQKGTLWIIIGIVWTLALIGIAMVLPENMFEKSRMLLPALNGLLLYPIINRLQGDKIREHFKNKGEKGSNWLVAGLTLGMVALILTPTILLDRISPINKYTRQAFDSNGIYYNSGMPLDEVNKLGGILQRIEYFNPESPVEVVFLTTDTTYELKLITEESFFNDSLYLNDIQQIYKHLDSYKFRKPLSFKITEPYLKDDKQIKLDKDSEIPVLLESVSFTKNPNFKLIYPLSVDESEREKFQSLILGLNAIFPAQNKFDFVLDLDDGKYVLRLIIPMQNWNTPQLLAEAKYCKERLNNFGFRHPFRLLLVDNSGIEMKEKEIE
ncbi:MAG: hypothetical protein K0M50_02785 [Prolixibacteraceae bacterium]|nr:hypothetical protein [Prolixibacteraceae bacterium]